MNDNDVEYLLKIKDDFSAVLDRFEVQAKKAEERGRKLHDSAKHAEGGFHDLKESILMVGEAMAVYEVFEFGKEALEDFDKLAQAQAGINQILKNTDESAGMTAESLKELAEKQQELTTFSARATMESEKQLLAFTNVRGEIYEKTIPAIQDMATFMRIDLKSATDIAGKALNNPAMAARLLRQEGIVLSKSQQELLSHLQATGKMAEAQELILGELQKRYGGAGEAAAHTGMGPLKQLGNQFEEVKEEIGEFISEGIGRLMPYLKDGMHSLKEWISAIKGADFSPIVDAFKELTEPLSDIITEAKALLHYFGLVSDKTSAVSFVIKVLAFNFRMVMAPIKLSIKFIQGFVHVIKEAVPIVAGTGYAIKEVFVGIGKIAKETFGGIADMIKGVFTLDTDKIEAGMGRLKTAYTSYGSNISRAYKEGYLKNMVLTPDEKKSSLGEFLEKGKEGKGEKTHDRSFVDMEAGASSVKEAKNTVINITMGALNQGGITVHTATLPEGASKVEEIMMKMFMSMVNNSQIIAGN